MIQTDNDLILQDKKSLTNASDHLVYSMRKERVSQADKMTKQTLACLILRQHLKTNILIPETHNFL